MMLFGAAILGFNIQSPKELWRTLRVRHSSFGLLLRQKLNH